MWEYKVVELAFQTPPDLEQLLNQYGSENWELAFVSSGQGIPSRWFVFKRRKVP